MKNKTKWIIFTVIPVAVVLLLAAGTLLLYSGRSSHRLRICIFSGNPWGTSASVGDHVYTDLISQFEMQQGKYTIEVSVYPVGDYSELLAQDILKGIEADVFMILPGDFAVLASVGILADLKPLIKESSFDLSVFYDNALKAGQYRNNQYALPLELNPALMLMNLSILESFGLFPPDLSWNWADFSYYIQNVTTIGNDIPCYYGISNWTWFDAVYSNQQTLFSESGDQALCTEEGVVEATRYYQEICSLYEGVMVPDFDSGEVLFSPCTYASYKTNAYFEDKLSNPRDFKWTATTIPRGPRGNNAGELKVLLMGISSRSRNKQGAWEFLQFVSAGSGSSRKILLESQGLPANRNGLAEYMGTSSGEGFDARLLETIINGSVVTPRFKKHTSALEFLSDTILNEQIHLETDISDYLKNLNDAIDIFLKE
ncbi:ABC transporter substrate-binding protein [Breznakiella homolactica]|uniref:Extracellular solute-binding protein n=1 Tax=Breznakiella homolactica TaxID=2798577 RepID=A0A7T7XNX5_9SPIR|nr:extracellular solute-binding protein [Breznakiella homolactica]QQO09788.1 extracellular solute-binding protein [Breznakiella homolactica]